MDRRRTKLSAWHRVREYFGHAASLGEAEREEYLDAIPGIDPQIRAEVETLLEVHDHTTVPKTSRPLIESENAATLTPSSILAGRFEIVRPLGHGGMGRVYEAHDQALGVRVALKTVLPRFVSDALIRERFKLEILNGRKVSHENVCRVHDLVVSPGEQASLLAFTMELLQGETLVQRLQHEGKVTPREALPLVRQMTEGLAALHEHNIIHRDFKPGNIFITEETGSTGCLKITDFGLARHEVGGDETSQPLKKSTELIGTLRYMAPEQLRDERDKVGPATDIYALGLVLYEMLTGKQPFPARTLAENISQKTRQAPTPPSQLVPDLSEEWDATILACLAVDPQHRPPTPGAVYAMLDNRTQTDSGFLSGGGRGAGLGGPSSSPGAYPVPDRSMRRNLFRYVAGGGVTAALLALVLWMAGVFEPAAVENDVPLQALPFTSLEGSETYASFSPDGSQIAFSWDGGEEHNNDIYVRVIGSDSVLRLTRDPADDVAPAWSPDGRYVAFLRSLSGLLSDRHGLYLTSPHGGQERRLAEVSSRFLTSGLAWTSDSRSLLFSRPDRSGEPPGIYALDIETDAVRRLTTPPPESLGDLQPQVSPDGKTLAFVRRMTTGITGLHLMPIGGGAPTALTSMDGVIRGSAWTANGREIVYSWGRLGQSSRLWRVSADGGGTPRPLSGAGEDGLWPALSGDGSRLIYARAVTDHSIWRYALAQDPQAAAGAPERLIASTRNERSVRISPDGNHIAFVSNRSGNAEVWVAQSDGSNSIALTSYPSSFSGSPSWSPDGERIAFDSLREGSWNIYTVHAQGGSPLPIVVRDGNDARPSWSVDGNWVYFTSNFGGTSEIWKVPVQGGDAQQVTTRGGYHCLESSDGRFLYYGKRGQPGLWRMPTGGGEEEVVVQDLESADQGFWDLIEDGVCFADQAAESSGSSGWLLKCLRFDEEEATIVTQLTRPPGTHAAPLDISPDGTWFAWAGTDQTTSDLMIVEDFR